MSSVKEADLDSGASLMAASSPIRTGGTGGKVGRVAAEERDGVRLTNLDEPLFEDAGATKRDLVDYLDGVSGRILPVLESAAEA